MASTTQSPLTKLTKVALPIAVITAASLFAVGCGEDTDSKSTKSTSAATASTTESDAMAKEELKDIVDTAVGAGSFTTLVSAIQAADLEETLRGEGPFTVFAPTDEAFDKLPAGTLKDLLKPENKEKLASILTYHVANGKVMSTDLSDGQKVPTVQGGTLAVSTADGVKIGTAKVVTPDIETSNGVIHVIDTVQLPK